MLDVNDPVDKEILDRLDSMDDPKSPVELDDHEPPIKPVKSGKKSSTIYDKKDVYNPYKTLSNLILDETMKSFRWIETDLLLTLIKKKTSSSELRIWLYILHMTRGFNEGKEGEDIKKMYRHMYYIENHEIVEMTGLSSSSVSEGLTKLKEKKMIYETYDRGGKRLLGCNYRYDTWK